LFYSAAHLMDSVEDQDEPDAWRQAAGPGAAINAASGLYFSGSLLLNDLYTHEATRPAAPQVTFDFYRTLLVMSSGQHQDLLNPTPTLEQYWQIAEAKSGEFFALACRGGARLAAEQPAILHGFSQFGKCLGVMLQALDDLSDVQLDPSGSLPDLGTKSLRCLPVVYALTVLPEARRSQLQAALHQAQENQAAKQDAYQLIDSSGAALYLLSKLHSLRSQALTGLERAGLHQAAIDGLADFLPEGQ
jgi:geranylgeranyl pyrophosphate synthase